MKYSKCVRKLKYAKQTIVLLLCLKYALVEKTQKNENICKNMQVNFLD